MAEADYTTESEEHFKNVIKRFGQRLGKGSDDQFTKYHRAFVFV